MSSTEARAQPCPVSAEQFRFELSLMLDDTRALGATLASTPAGNPALAGVSKDLAPLVAAMRRTDLQLLCGIFERHPELALGPARLRAAVPAVGVLEGGECTPFSPDIYLALFVIAKVLEGAEVIAGAACNAAACPIYAGVGACLPAPPECSLVCPIVLGIAKALNIAARAVLAQDDHCASSLHYSATHSFLDRAEAALGQVESDLGVLVPLLDVEVSTRASQEDADELHSELDDRLAEISTTLDDLDTTVQTLQQAADAFAEMERRLRVETSLQEGIEGAVSSLLLPQSFGGELEQVREAVADALLMNQAVGADITEALHSFDLGDQSFNLGFYRLAYQQFRTAYQQAAAAPAGP